MFAIVAFSVFALVAAGGWALALAVRARAEADYALEQRLGVAGRERAQRPASLLKDQRLSSIAPLDWILLRLPFVPGITRVIRAGLRRRAGEVLMYMPLLACIAFLLTMLVNGGVVLAFMLAMLAGAAPLIVVYRMKQTRALQFAEQLPDALDLIRAALQAGHGFATALGVVANEFPNPIAEEFREVAEETRLGLPLRDALYNLNDRIDDGDLPVLIVGVLIADESGGNLAEVLDNISHTVRERFKMTRDIRTLTAQGRLSGAVLTALPLLVGSVNYLLNPTYFNPMVTTSIGHYLLLYAFASLVVGHFVIRRIVQLDV
ncbi:MAG: hypothetical protein E6J72_16960 [Deltaproteobacteria bacterium]|nr:MAG: hypothetical protein E6J72_16960 [Deltaproteobacteria bacterium]